MGVCGSKVDEKSLPRDPEGRYLQCDDFWKLYRYEKTIAKGGSCDVLQIVHIETGQVWAGKELHEYKNKVDKLFKREVDILKMLGEDHKNIVKFHDAYRDKRNFFIVTQFLKGGELFDRIVAAQHYSEKVCSNIIQMMLHALKHLHDFNIVHRDLKPENFVFDGEDINANIRMIDFGTALHIKDQKKTYKEICGTPYYMPPEAVRNKRRNLGELKAGDVFGLGVITYIMMSGQPPFPGQRDDEIFERIKKCKWKVPNHVQWSDSLVDFITKCLKEDPRERITVDEAMYHPWVTGATASGQQVTLQVLSSLRNFVRDTDLQKAIVKLMVANVGSDDEKALTQMFRRVDSDRDGKITRVEIEASLKEMGMYGPQAIKEADRIMKDVDENGDGNINFDEFVKARARNKLSTDIMVLHAVFNLLDENDDGHIDKTELTKIFHAASEADQHISKMINEVDTDQDGQISFEEFMNCLSTIDVDPKQVADALSRSVRAEEAVERVKTRDRLLSERQTATDVFAEQQKEIVKE